MFTADITNLSMITFKAVAQQLPVVLRQWFITLDRKAGSLVEEYVCLLNSTVTLAWVLTGSQKNTSPLYFGKISWLLLKHRQGHLIIWRYICVCLGHNCVKWLCAVFMYLYTYLQLIYCSCVYLCIYFYPTEAILQNILLGYI